MLNNVTLMGRAGDEPEVQNFASGAKMAKVSMACTRPTKNKETDWFDIEIWGKAADVAASYLHKGDRFAVVGALRQDKWEKDGNKRSKVIVSAQQLRLVERKGETEPDAAAASAPNPSANTDLFDDSGDFE